MTVKPRMKDEIESIYATTLKPYATHKPRENSREQKNQSTNNKDNRGSFQRDRDRIIHTKAFRRLMYKTQVFVNHEGDHFRTRLTHTLEVSQLARGLCKSLGLNEDLAEAIALGHDLGHTPFGHAIEEYFDEVLSSQYLGNFYHNEQSVRIVDRLEQRRRGELGLDLTYEVREGILKHTKDSSGIYRKLNSNQVCSSLEGQIVRMVDTIAYICHDFEDGIKAGIIEQSVRGNQEIKHRFNDLNENIKLNTGIEIHTNPYEDTFFIANLLHWFIEQLTYDSCKSIEEYNIQSLEDVQKEATKGNQIIRFLDKSDDFFKHFKKFIYKNVYNSRTIAMMDRKAIALVSEMYQAFLRKPELLPPTWEYKFHHIDDEDQYDGAKDSKERTICDYISRMTDRYALEEGERLFNPSARI